MNNKIKNLLDKDEISVDQYNKICEYLKDMEFDYYEGNDLTKYDYEGFVHQTIGCQDYSYPAEDIAIELYKLGEFKELIKNVIYKNNIKVLSKLDKSF